MEHETPVPELVDRPRPRLHRSSTRRTGPELSPAEQKALGGAIDAPAGALRSSTVIGLQRTAGNTAVTALLQRNLTATEDEEALSPVLGIVGQGRGQALDAGLRDEMEARLGADFSDVRIHTDSEASRSAAAVAARAYTVGNEVVLGADAPDLSSDRGKRTLAHELTHVLQQRSGPVAGTPTGNGIAISDPSDRFEQAAEANADRVMSHSTSDLTARGARDSGGGAMAPAPTQREAEDVAEEMEEGAEEMQESAEEMEAGAEELEGEEDQAEG